METNSSNQNSSAINDNNDHQAEHRISSHANKNQKKKLLLFIRRLIKKITHKHPAVGVLRLSGIIATSGGFGKQSLNLDDLDETIEKTFNISKLKAIALQINSPGGSPVQTELIYRRIRHLAEEKKVPVYTFAEDVAASGGYWLACAGDEIYVSENSLIGSIGVVSGGFGFTDAIKKMGIERRIYAQGKNKAILDPFREERAEDVKILTSAQKDVHESFINLVKSRRGKKLKIEEEDRLFSGEFWSGKKAIELGLADGSADMYSFIQAKYGKNIKFVKTMKPKNWLKRKLGIESFVYGIGQSLVNAIVEKITWERFGL